MSRPIISSVHNQRIKDVAKLRDRRQRGKQQRTLIDGEREIERAFQTGFPIADVFFCEAPCQEARHGALVERLEAAGISVLGCTPEVFAKIAFGERAEGLVAVAETPQRSLADLALPPHALVAVLVSLEKPGNVGAVLRSADAAGVGAVIVVDGGTDLFNPNTIRASLGTIFTVPVCEATTSEALKWLRDGSYCMVAARVDGARSYADANYRGATAIILGSESDGLPKAWQEPDIAAIQLPMLGMADSLNVSATAAVLFYEALRQRTHAG
jgi:TrmH family RNA methyltransferase